MPNGGLQQVPRPSLEPHIRAPRSELSPLEPQKGLFSHGREMVQLIQMDISQVSLLGQISEFYRE